MPPVLHLRDIHLTFGGKPTLDGAELAVSPGERIALVGRNGSGKSTLLKIAAGVVDPDDGEIFRQPGATIRYLPQEPDLTGHARVSSFVMAGLAPGDDEHRARYLVENLGLTGDEDPATLSGGEARRAALARALAPAPDILLLDEPTNHLDLPAIEWLEAELAGSASAIVLISHDRRFLQNLTAATVWLDRGATRRLERGFAHFEEWRDAEIAAEEERLHKLDRKIASETEWLHKGVTARRKRNMGRLRALHDLRSERRNYDKAQGRVEMAASEAAKSGKRVIEAEHVSKSFGDRTVIRDFSLRILRGDRIGIVGPNGAGKTTLLKLLLGDLEPDEGRIARGTNLEIATLDQRRESLDPKMSLGDALTGGGGDMVAVGGEQRHVIGYMKDFLFDPKQRPTAISALSGGERGRLMLARALARPSNLLVLDEPTNDLDIETLDLLQELLADYGGTILLVSHDRDFLDRCVTATVAFEGDGRWTVYAGGYSDMMRQRAGAAKEAAAEAAARKPDGAGKTKPAQKSRKPAVRKLSYKQKYALETLPDRIAELEGEMQRLEAELADRRLFTQDPERFRAATKRLEAAAAEHAAAESEWLELEMLREEIEGG
ncbi:ABC-F family ATP-binding cassette domain-containing protein [Minwuia thermotolerans]|uniref:ATP-binding protein Uup n=1 Tax=Minwuia thermotolerans TaxID=2056226 RepID=A0A2M9G107_9PROT|nr:ATP-binding cassette domain-containing protein [Minwuia thermotolerans]PJK29400.1 elongation factor 3 [Minwuia thermotolerans]